MGEAAVDRPGVGCRSLASGNDEVDPLRTELEVLLVTGVGLKSAPGASDLEPADGCAPYLAQAVHDKAVCNGAIHRFKQSDGLFVVQEAVVAHFLLRLDRREHGLRKDVSEDVMAIVAPSAQSPKEVPAWVIERHPHAVHEVWINFAAKLSTITAHPTSQDVRADFAIRWQVKYWCLSQFLMDRKVFADGSERPFQVKRADSLSEHVVPHVHVFDPQLSPIEFRDVDGSIGTRLHG